MQVLDGSILMNGGARRRTETFRAVSRTDGTVMEPAFCQATVEDVSAVCELASAAFDAYRGAPLATRAMLLEAIAENIEGLGEELITRTMLESGLSRARLEGERARTVGQLRLFAGVVRAGEWLGLRIDTGLPERTPLPRPDLRLRHVPLGPVAVFGASNFPLAFSVAGGDTVSALAAGCPIIVKGHPAHPGTSELVGRTIQAAVARCALPPGLFALLQGESNEIGAALVADPRIRAVGFTGSRAGGLALMQIAAKRTEPIPVYAEMSSVNPVLLFPGALRKRAQALGEGFIASLTLGAGQFCTNPGLLLGVRGKDLESFIEAAAQALHGSKPQTMLTQRIQETYENGVAALAGHPKVRLVARGDTVAGGTCGQAALFRTTAQAVLADDLLTQEVFGASSVMVECESIDEMRAVLVAIEGQLTISLQIEEEDIATATEFVPLLEKKAGRLLANGWPTGVEVAHAMVHGGPFPATSDGRSTSVGTLAIRRFLRPVCYQAMPGLLLPAELRSGSQGQFPLMRDGEYGC
jgi:alpha-ketoglutaric semialdehyde dehydrogenase